MTQIKLGDILYIFQITPYEITEDTDAAVIKVQQESYDGFIELNQSLADKIVKYNYYMMTVTEQEWAPYANEHEPEEYEFNFSGTGDVLDHLTWYLNGDEFTPEAFPFTVDDNDEVKVLLQDGLMWYDLSNTDGGYTYWDPDTMNNYVIWDMGSIGHDVNATINYYEERYKVSEDKQNFFFSEQYNYYFGPYQYNAETGMWESWFPAGVLFSVYATESQPYYEKELVFSPDYSDGGGTYGPAFILEGNMEIREKNEYTLYSTAGTIILDENFDPVSYEDEADERVYTLMTYTSYYIDQSDDQKVGYGKDAVFSHNGAPLSSQYVTVDTSTTGYTLFEATNEILIIDPVAIELSFVQHVEPFYTLTLDGYDIHDHIDVYFDNVQQQTEVQYQDVPENTVIDIYPTETSTNYTLVSGATWDTDHWTATMPNDDLTIVINYTAPVQASPTVKVQYDVRNNSEPVTIYTWPDSSFDSNVPDQMFVDGAEETVSDTYQFDSTGTHTIEYVFNDGCFDIGLNGIDPSYNSIGVASVEVNDAITSVADYAWGIKVSQPGESELSPLPLTYLPTVPPTINSTGASDVEAPGATVYVPADSVTDYQQASVWSDISSLIQAIVPA